jgi:hypothetical protein
MAEVEFFVVGFVVGLASALLATSLGRRWRPSPPPHCEPDHEPPIQQKKRKTMWG